MDCKICGTPIAQERINAVTLNGKFDLPKVMTGTCCMTKHDVSRKAGYMPSESKMKGSIIITDERTVTQYHKDAARGGTGVASGVKFRTGRR